MRDGKAKLLSSGPLLLRDATLGWGAREWDDASISDAVIPILTLRGQSAQRRQKSRI